ncbi:MAG: helix-turn-helix domain-containing protein [Acetatifactor sp.]
MYNRFEVGERLTQVREEHGRSQDWLAEKVCCSVITISRWENGHTQMKGEDISKVCTVLGISADYLLGLPVKTELGLLEGLNKLEINIVMQSMRAMVAALKSNRSDK